MKVNINTPDYWDEVYRGEWERDEVGGAGYRRDYGPIHDAIVDLVPDGSSVLDIGCGSGVLCRKIKRRKSGAQVLGIDFSQYAIAQNREADKELLIEYRCVDVRRSLDSVGRQFDVVTMCEIIEHLEEAQKAVDDAMALLRAGGRFILSCPHDDQIPDPEHVRLWGHDEIFHLLMPYGGTISFMHFPPPYFHVWMLAFLTREGKREV